MYLMAPIDFIKNVHSSLTYLISFMIKILCVELFQKQLLSRDVLRKRCSENMQQIYSRTPMSKCEATLLKSHFVMSVLL